jgi:hypothetical protein
MLTFLHDDILTKVFQIESVADDSLNMLSLVVPTLDVDFENDTKTKLCGETRMTLGQRKGVVEYDDISLQHIQHMKEMTTYLHASRSLYSSTGGSDELRLSHRVQQQVLCLHLRKLGAPKDTHSVPRQRVSDGALQQSSFTYANYPSSRTNRGMSKIQPSSEQHNQTSVKALRRDSTTHTNFQNQEFLASSSQPDTTKSMLRGIVIPQLWMLIIFTKGKQ